jgi:hypothetical protein
MTQMIPPIHHLENWIIIQTQETHTYTCYSGNRELRTDMYIWQEDKYVETVTKSHIWIGFYMYKLNFRAKLST